MRLHDLDVDEYLGQCVTVNRLALEDEFVRIGADFAYWGHQYADAHEAHLLAKLDLDRAQARLRIEHRIRLTESARGSKDRITESMVDAVVECDDEHVDARRRAIEAEARRERLKTVLEAVRTKRDMLVTIGANVRAEMASDPIVRRQHEGARDVRENY